MIDEHSPQSSMSAMTKEFYFIAINKLDEHPPLGSSEILPSLNSFKAVYKH